MRHGSLFSGIGGFDLAAEWMGWTNVFHTEWNEFGQKVLKHHFPNSIQYHDIIKTDYTIHYGDIDIITGGFPCQPFSNAGKRKGKEDERYLWHEMLRAIQQIQPTYVVAENVRGLLTIDGGMVFEQVCLDLEAEGYQVQPVLLPAAGVNAPHRRDRIFIIAYSNKCDDRRTSRADETASRKEWLSERHQVRQSSKPSEVQQPAANTISFGRQDNTRSVDGKAEETDGKRQHTIHTWTECDGTSRITANTNDTGTKQQMRSERTRKKDDQGWQGQPQLESWKNGINEPAANTNSRRQSAEEHRQAQPRWISEESIPNNWQDFPTESAICGGNDGIPDRLDGITFPKWRNESIKAYGNAVVPQLILPIFQTIQKLHREKNT